MRARREIVHFADSVRNGVAGLGGSLQPECRFQLQLAALRINWQ
jgi:hypothetical protein